MEKFVKIGFVGIVILFTLFAFVFEQPCDSDAIYLWCRVHPLSVVDIIGLLLFYVGTLGRLVIKSESVEGATGWAWAFWLVPVVGVILLWNF